MSTFICVMARNHVEAAIFSRAFSLFSRSSGWWPPIRDLVPSSFEYLSWGMGEDRVCGVLFLLSITIVNSSSLLTDTIPVNSPKSVSFVLVILLKVPFVLPITGPCPLGWGVCSFSIGFVCVLFGLFQSHVALFLFIESCRSSVFFINSFWANAVPLRTPAISA